ncbi:uncharacterized protein LOC123194607 [Mangifera indica]|uniref:uncharacterized protein LOC123194607 n=1 Tax=Mangifera indica TaxID=29780 RepID=UPI001CFAA98C|nr:uncharacterized protein LOC123194607 [Mangifera indica]
MLDGLLGRGFGSKCKSLIKLIKSRIDVIRRKRNATQKFLKKDIADLLANGLDIKAYGRADGLLAELNVSYCYDFVEQSCDFVLKHLSVLQKVSNCPEACREAASSLMFAAARFSDLLELRDLRQLFQERYGNTLEYFVNQEFVDKLAAKPATMEKKVQLMQDIASEFSIKWDSRAFWQRMSKPSASSQDQPKSLGPSNVPKGKHKSVNSKETNLQENKHEGSYKDTLEHAGDGHRLHNGKESNPLKRNELILPHKHVSASDGYKPVVGREETILKMDHHDISLQGKQEVTSDRHEAWDRKEDTALIKVRAGSSSHGRRMEHTDGTFKAHGDRENAVPKRQIKDNLPYGKAYIGPSYAEQHSKSNGKDLLDSDSHGGQHNNANSTRKVQDEEIVQLKPHYSSALPPPYVKHNAKPKDGKYEANLGYSPFRFDGEGVPIHPSVPITANVGDISERDVRSTRAKTLDDEKDCHCKDDGAGNPIQKARSVQRRHPKSPSGHDSINNATDAGVSKRKSRSRRRDNSIRGLQILFDDEHHQNNEEERRLDKLLMHYSKKPSTYEEGYARRKSRSRQAHPGGNDILETPQAHGGDVSDDMAKVVHPVRSISLPCEQPASLEAKKVFVRAASFQPDRSNAAGHVHPKLPDYDDLAARFAALKGR